MTKAIITMYSMIITKHYEPIVEATVMHDVIAAERVTRNAIGPIQNAITHKSITTGIMAATTSVITGATMVITATIMTTMAIDGMPPGPHAGAGSGILDASGRRAGWL